MTKRIIDENWRYWCIRHPDDHSQPGREFAAVGRATRDAAFRLYAYQIGVCWSCVTNQERVFVQHANQRRTP